MSNLFISTASMSGAGLAAIRSAQEQLVRLQKEVATGKIADTGLELGHRSKEPVGLHQTLAMTEAIKGTNAIVLARLDTSQTSLAGIEKTAQDFLGALLGARGSSAASAQIESQARAALRSIGALLNSEVGGVYVFGGQSSAGPPMTDYLAASGSAARQSVQQAFSAAFGIASDDPAVGQIDAAAMRAFLDGPLEAELADPAWSARWSQATSEGPVARIALGEMQEVGASASEAPFRQLTKALVMVGDLGGAALNAQTRQVVLDEATSLIGSAMTGLASIRSRLGIAEERTTAANERLSLQSDIAQSRLQRIETADPYETATALNELMTRLDASYATTARIQKLSLLDYL